MATGEVKILSCKPKPKFKANGIRLCRYIYHHRPDPNTPLEETMGALDLIVRQGKALYVGISNYPTNLAKEAINILNELGTLA